MMKPWIEKYRPVRMNDIVEQDEVVNILKNTMINGNLPNIIFYGPAGCGKTSTILSFSRELYGKIVNDRIMELNASDERGIKIVREKILTFVKSSISNVLPSFKLIILDEADAMTTEAQSALRIIMEEYSKKTRFCFICNYINQLIEPIKSRCMLFRFKPISHKAISKRLRFIADSEKLDVKDDVIKILSKKCNGDARQAILMLQNLKYLNNCSKETVLKVLNIISNEEIDRLYSKISSIDEILIETEKTKRMGFSIKNVLEEIIKKIIKDKDLTDKNKSLITIEGAKMDKIISEGCSDELVLLRMLSYIRAIKNEK